MSGKTVSDEERRDIAEGLRRLAGENEGALGMGRLHEVGEQAKALMGTARLPSCAAVMRRYADLIDRPTCRAEARGGAARCSLCGAAWAVGALGYCPSCGAEVVG